MVVDFEKRLVIRNGTTIVLRRKLNRAILKLLEASRDVPCSSARLLQAWGQEGSLVERNAVYKAVSDLRKALKPLSISITVVRDSGWMLTVSPERSGKKRRTVSRQSRTP